jgi:hypothetical protein
MITVGGKVINPEHVTLVTHPTHSAYVQVYLVNGKQVEVSVDSLVQHTYDEAETPLQIMRRLLEEGKRYWIQELARAICGDH